jgi:hypothetical protein
MKKLLIALPLLLLAFSAGAREHDNLLLSVPNAGSMAPKGFYYTFGYNTGRAVNNFDREGAKIINTGYKFQTWSVTNFFQWMTGKEFLGASYGMKFGFGYVDNLIQQTIAGNYMRLRGDGITDPVFTPIVLGWKLSRLDITPELAVYFPFGYYTTRSGRLSIGQDHFTLIPKLGATLYITEDRSWSLGGQLAYEYNFKNSVKDIGQGEQLYAHYSLTKQFSSGISLSAVGYYSRKLNGDTGSDASPATKDVLDTVFAIGPEARAVIPEIASTVSLKYIKEFNAKSRAETDLFRISFTWKF